MSQILARCKALTESYQNQSTAQMWLDLLDDVPIIEINTAFKLHMQANDKFPTYHQIYKILKEERAKKPENQAKTLEAAREYQKYLDLSSGLFVADKMAAEDAEFVLKYAQKNGKTLHPRNLDKLNFFVKNEGQAYAN